MIGFGAFSMAPAATSGILALSQADITTDAQRHMLSDHTWQQSAACVLALLTISFWLACSDIWRRRLYLPALAGLVLAVALSVVGAWHAGEAVYRYGTNVVAVDSPGKVTPRTTPTDAAKRRDVTYFVDPLDAHVVMAGITTAFTVFALAMAGRRLTQGAGGPVLFKGQPTPPPQGSYAPLLATGAIVAGVATSALGWWYLGPLTLPKCGRKRGSRIEDRRSQTLAFCDPLSSILYPRFCGTGSNVRGSYYLSRPKWLAVITLLFVASLSLQIWLGVLMLFDSPHGPVMAWETAE